MATKVGNFPLRFILISVVIYLILSFFSLFNDWPSDEILIVSIFYGALFSLMWGDFSILDQIGYMGVGSLVETNGLIKGIRYISSRYGKPHVAVVVEYAGIEREISWVGGEITLHFSVGDTVVIEYNKNNKMRSRINIDKSLERKFNPIEKNSTGSTIQVDSIIKQPMMGFYRVKGKIISGDYSGRDVSIVTLLDSDKAERMQPGSVVDCNVSEFDGELVVSFS